MCFRSYCWLVLRDTNHSLRFSKYLGKWNPIYITECEGLRSRCSGIDAGSLIGPLHVFRTCYELTPVRLYTDLNIYSSVLFNPI
ncbi:unnamed protein product [Heterobilharzia americana]|nr:unnamed protein product [Heterobilharzia americana]CAH8511370.1 unnamed protein product [Heterobilharzia americana]